MLNREPALVSMHDNDITWASKNLTNAERKSEKPNIGLL